MKKLIASWQRSVLISILTVGIVSCVTMPISDMPSKNFGHRVKFLVMHFTAIDYQKSVHALVDEGGLSAHYLIPESNDPSYPNDSLEILKLVDEDKRAWHAGNSVWQGRSELNDSSIGIEIVNVPECHVDSEAKTTSEHGENRLCVFPDYDPKQIELLIALSKDILARNPDISPTRVVGHADIAPARKNDPGPRFPWFELYQAGIGAWYDNDTFEQYWQRFNQYQPNFGLVQSALRAYGYNVLETGIRDEQTRNAISAFQMHFLPWQVTGKADSKTAAAIFALLDKYFNKKAKTLMARYIEEQVPQAKENKVVKHGQVDEVFPMQQRSTRQLVNDRKRFKAYQGRGQIQLTSQGAAQADIYVNGQKLNINQPFEADKRYQYSLKRRTRDGMNTLRVDNILPQGSELKVTIPSPVLIDSSASYQNRFKQVDDLIEQDVKNGFPGAVLLVMQNGEIIKRSAYGDARKFADGGALLPSAQKMRTDTLFDIASNTKMFATNLALMKLVSEEKLDVNAPIEQYMPDYQGGGRDTRLVRDLLTHTAGYAPQVRFFTPDNGVSKSLYSQNPQRTDQLLLNRVPFAMGRNVKAVYSDTDYMLLGMLVERLTGMGLDAYVEHQIYQPLGLTNTLFNPLLKGRAKAEFAATEIQGNSRGGRVSFDNMREYVLQGEVHDEKAFYSLGGVAGHAGLFSTVDDLAVLGQLLLNSGGYGQSQIFDEAVLQQFIKPEERDDSYGLGWRRAGHGQSKWHFGPYASAQAYGHTGWTGTVSVIDPKYDLAIFLLTNARHSKVQEDDSGHVEFAGKTFETGKYGSIISLVYEAVLNAK
ncbi:MAG: penicillin binding protein PBP4B [Alteromonadaceae bacterium]|uniref:penicillin binding protein PBP4B n=1 Tax=Paraglaciecola chathamensis TaxID=368405 RepID=UPI000C4C9EC5|nr:penicillin binding protein PBP4B [Paraglaciecola agarilytica]MBN25654.1 penicillin binding protein PBP4B [Alteromonadaceae bacterium]|tara:strand:+ start:40670 stop:43126 length:2457 start_codon:yes stop_codon:yes gene_type:complete